MTRGEVLGALEREAKRAADLYEAAQAVVKLDDEKVVKQREVAQLADAVKTEVEKLAVLQKESTRLESLTKAAAANEAKRVAEVVAAAEARVARARADADAQVKAIAVDAEAAIARLRQEREFAERAADTARGKATEARDALAATVQEWEAKITALREEYTALKQRLLSLG